MGVLVRITWEIHAREGHTEVGLEERKNHWAYQLVLGGYSLLSFSHSRARSLSLSRALSLLSHYLFSLSNYLSSILYSSHSLSLSFSISNSAHTRARERERARASAHTHSYIERKIERKKKRKRKRGEERERERERATHTQTHTQTRIQYRP